jgi:hypothetical protein
VLGKIRELVNSEDRFIRSAKVQTASGKVLEKPLCLLYLIETYFTKKVRKAAIVAKQRIKMSNH